MPTTTIGNVKSMVSKQIVHMKNHEDAKSMPIYLHSSPGIGKSAIIDQIANENDMGFVDVRLAQFEASDVQGIPFVRDDEEGNQIMDVSTPDWFPSKERVANSEFPERGILFFDELSNAPIPVQHAAYRVILDREVHRGCELADGWIIVAAGNKKEDKTGAKGVAPALANRFAIHFDIKESLDDFTAYAVAKNFDESIIGFLNFDSSKLYKFDPKKNEVAFATPRSWEQVNNLMKVGYSGDELAMVLGGCVGDAVTSEFMAFQKYYKDLPDFNKIMSGEMDYKIPKDKDRGVIYALVSSLIIHLANNASDKKKVENLNKILTQLPDDFLTLTYRSLKSALNMSGEGKKSVANILMVTRDNWSRVSKYIDGRDSD